MQPLVCVRNHAAVGDFEVIGVLITVQRTALRIYSENDDSVRHFTRKMVDTEGIEQRAYPEDYNNQNGDSDNHKQCIQILLRREYHSIESSIIIGISQSNAKPTNTFRRYKTTRKLKFPKPTNFN